MVAVSAEMEFCTVSHSSAFCFCGMRRVHSAFDIGELYPRASVGLFWRACRVLALECRRAAVAAVSMQREEGLKPYEENHHH